MRRLIRQLTILVSLVTSIVIGYSVLWFGPFRMHVEQSEYRLARYDGVTAAAAASKPTVQHLQMDGIKLESTVVNSVKVDGNRFTGVLEAPSFVEFDIPRTHADDAKIVTRIIIDVPPLRLYDQRIVHWQTSDHGDYSDNRYYKYPISSLSGRQTLFVDGDVTRLRIMVTLGRGARFRVNAVVVDKYQIS